MVVVKVHRGCRTRVEAWGERVLFEGLLEEGGEGASVARLVVGAGRRRRSSTRCWLVGLQAEHDGGWRGGSTEMERWGGGSNEGVQPGMLGA